MRESGERGVVGGRGEGRGGAEGKEKGRSWVEDSKLASLIQLSPSTRRERAVDWSRRRLEDKNKK